MQAKRQKAIAILFLMGLVTCLGLTAFVYWEGLNGSFMLDDYPNIVQVYLANPDWDAIKYTVASNASGLFGRSISILSFILSGLQQGLDPWIFKYHNLLLHLLNGVLLFCLLQRLLPLLDRELDEKTGLLIAGAGAALWLLHPLHVSTVLYAVQRMAQLATLFTLLALVAYLSARRGDFRGMRFWLLGWFLFPLMTLFAVMAKETGALVPLYLLCIELFAFRTTMAQVRADRRLALFLGTFILLPLVLGVVVMMVNFDLLTDYGNRTFTMGERLLTQVHVFFFYIRQILLPRLSAMSLFLDDYAVTSSLDLQTAMLIALLGGLLWLIWRLRLSSPVIAFGLAWFVVSHLLESTFLPLDLVFEHRNYLASVGLLLLPVYGAFKVAAYPALRLVPPVLVTLFAFMTSTRAAEWGERELFFKMAVDEHPRSSRALTTYVNFLMGQRRYDESLRLLERQLELRSREAGAYLHLQLAKCSAGLRDDAAMATALELLGHEPVSVYTLNALQNMVVVVIDRKCEEVSLDEMEAMVDAALAYPGNQEYERNRAYLLRMRGLVAFAKEYYAQGYSYFRQAHEILGDVTLLTELMRYELTLGRFEDADETMAMIEEQNRRRLGIDQYHVERARDMLARTRQAVALAEEQKRTAEREGGAADPVIPGTVTAQTILQSP